MIIGNIQYYKVLVLSFSMTDITIISELTQTNLKPLWQSGTYFIANPSITFQWLPETTYLRKYKNNCKARKKK